ncbi:MAG: hypothetical protein KC442_24715 [Thermomicrobiales bacterium]|nr:hypothetical protein [Thermomicrobiales bacterium]
MAPPLRYETPFSWWGSGPAPASPLTLPELLGNGTLALEEAAILWAALAQRRSLTVIGGPSGLGKTTLLHALLPALPRETHRVYLRGCYETFAFLSDSRLSPDRCVLLANEISPHLPVYLWGTAVQRTLEARSRGYPLLATAHGRSVTEFVASLTGSPLRVPAPLVASFDLLALVEPSSSQGGRRLAGLWQLSPGARGGVALDQVGTDCLPRGVSAEQVAASAGLLRATTFGHSASSE